MATDPDEGQPEDGEWTYSLADLEDEEADGDAEDDESDAEEGLDAGVAGTLDVEEELEAGSIDPENALFVVIGVLLALGFLAGFLNLI